MVRIILGYGECEGHTLPELSNESLEALSRRFPLEHDKYDLSDGRTLLITIAIHEEIRRRDSGGQQKKRIPTLKELAMQLVTKGHHQLSKVHHPDRNGAAEAQRLLNEARDHLLNACRQIADDNDDAIIISAQEEVAEVTDEDIPF